jgi:hypothetical protein
MLLAGLEVVKEVAPAPPIMLDNFKIVSVQSMSYVESPHRPGRNGLNAYCYGTALRQGMPLEARADGPGKLDETHA